MKYVVIFNGELITDTDDEVAASYSFNSIMDKLQAKTWENNLTAELRNTETREFIKIHIESGVYP